MKNRITLSRAVMLLIVLALAVGVSACSITLGSKEITVGQDNTEDKETSQLNEQEVLQTAVAATLTASAASAAQPTATPTMSEENKVQTAVAATLTAVAPKQTTPVVGTTAVATPTPKLSSQAQTATPKPTKVKKKTPAPKPASTPIPKTGFVLDFENFGVWQRGVQPYGELKATNEKVHEGEYAAKLSYDFPKVQDDFVVFLKKPPAPIPGEPQELTMWVYGDGSQSFLNVWVIDSENEVRQFTFGKIEHKDEWRPMTAKLDTSAEWPQDHISGPDNGKLDYPIRLYGIVLDSISQDASKGAIYLDELVVGNSTAENVPKSTPAPGATATQTPAPPPAALSGHIAYARANGGTTEVRVLDVATGNSWPILNFGRQPDINHSGNLIILDAIGNGLDSLVLANIDGTNPHLASNHVEDSYPNWSPDDTQLVYHSALCGSNADCIYIQYGMGQEPTALKVKGIDAFGRFPVWLPNWRIAYTGCAYWQSGSECGIWSMASDGSGEPIRITTNANDISTDAFGNSLLYASESSGNWDLYIVPIGGGAARNLTNNPAQDVAGTFSPDGRSIAFISSRGGSWAIWVMNADGSNPRKLKDVPEGFGNEWQISHMSWGP